MLPLSRWIALCLTVVFCCAVAPSAGSAQAIPGGPPPVPSRPPRTAGLWTAVGIGSGLVAGSIVLGGFGASVGRREGPECADQLPGGGCSQAATDAHNRKYWRFVGGSLALGLVGLVVGVWGIVGLRRAHRVKPAHAALRQFDVSLDPRAPQLSWGTRF